MHYQNDQWTLKDNLGLGKVGDEVAKMILQTTPPFTIGITGKWGSGKTSILRRSYATLGGLPIQQALAFSNNSGVETIDNENLAYHQKNRQPKLAWHDDTIELAKNCRCVWFSPWQHQNESNPLIPLLLEIQSQFSTWNKTKQKAGEINRRGGLATTALFERLTDAALTITAGKNIKVATGTTDAVRKAWHEAQPNLVAPSDGQRFHLLFEDAVNVLLGAQHPLGHVNENARLVIFIDDLDRCEEAIIVRLLEAMKLYLNSQKCVFVLGLDDTAVVDALGRYWQRSEDLNREYLEKLFQTRVPVPLPRPQSITAGIEAQLSEHEIPHQSKMAEDIEKLLEPNPRKVKNFVNGLCAAWSVMGAASRISHEEQDEDNARRFVMFHYIQQYHRTVWRLLERQPQTLRFLTVVLTNKGLPELDVNDPSELKPDEQRLLMEMFRRAFSHVLKNEARLDSGEDVSKHSGEDLDLAVEKFLQRQDRKRSDEYLRQMFVSLIEPNEVLNEQYLYAEQMSSNS